MFTVDIRKPPQHTFLYAHVLVCLPHASTKIGHLQGFLTLKEELLKICSKRWESRDCRQLTDRQSVHNISGGLLLRLLFTCVEICLFSAVNKTNLVHSLSYYVYFSSLHVAGHCVLIIIPPCTPDRSSTQSDKYQVSHRHSCFSWWWAHTRPQHGEKRNKHSKINCAPSWFYLQHYTWGGGGRTVNRT
jgi:hypothetical protein